MKIRAMVAALLLLTACQTTQKPTPPVVINTNPPIVAQKPDPLALRPVEWKVYNTAELAKVANENQVGGKNIVIFTLDDSNFKSLLWNMKAIEGYVKQQNDVITNVVDAANVNQPKAEPTK
jgi:hypothetical protein